MAEAEVLADGHVIRTEALDQHGVDELRRRLNGEAVVERDHDELVDPERRDQLCLDLERRSSFGAASGLTTRSGCGSNVSTVSLPRITSR